MAIDNKKTLIILLAVVSTVSFVEIFNLTKASLWHDESFSALLAEYDFPEMIRRIQLDVHPPLYYILLKGWTAVFDNSLFSLRMFSVFFSAMAIWAVFLFINKAFRNRTLALFASLLYAASYFQMQYAMEARMYSLGTLFAVLSGYLLLTALEKRKIKWWFAYALTVSLGIYTHYFIALWVTAQAIYLILFFRRELKFAAMAYSLVLISYIPWLSTLLKQFSQVQETYWIPAMSIWSIPNTFSKMTFGGIMDPSNGWPVLALLVIAVIAAIAVFLKKNQAKEKWLLAISLIMPFLITAALSYKRSIYIDRYFIFGFPFYAAILAGAILAIDKKAIKTILVLSALIGVSLTFPFQWSSLDVEKKPGMSAATEYVNENIKPGEKIFVGSSLIYFVFKYYNESGIEAKLYAPDALPHFSGTALLSPKDIIANFSKETKPGDVVWMLNTTGFGNYQPSAPQNWFKLEEKGFDEVNAYQGWILVQKYKVN